MRGNSLNKNNRVWCNSKKIAKMAMDTYVGESATYRASKDIEDRIENLKSDGKKSPRS